MKQELDKCVLVIDEAMPRGLAANTAAILGITWGRLRPELVGGGRDRRCPEPFTPGSSARRCRCSPAGRRLFRPCGGSWPSWNLQMWRLWTSQIWPRAAVPTASSSKKWPAPGRGAAIPGHGPFGPPASGGPADRKPAAAAVGKKRKNGAAPGCGPILVSFPGGLMAPAGSTDPPQHHRHWCTNSCRQSRSLPRWHTTYYRIGSMRR